MANETETWDRGELVTTIGPLSIFRSASAFTPEGAENDSEIQIEHRYTVRVDPSWVTTGGMSPSSSSRRTSPSSPATAWTP